MRFNRNQMGLLESFGLARGASAEDTLAFYNALETGQRELVDALATAAGAAPASPAGAAADDAAPRGPPSPAAGNDAPTAPPTLPTAPAPAASAAANGSPDDRRIADLVSRGVAEHLTREEQRRSHINATCDHWEQRGYDLTQPPTGQRLGLRGQLLADMSIPINDCSSRILGAISTQEDAGGGAGSLVRVGSTGGERFATVADQVLLAAIGVQSDYVYEQTPYGYELRRDVEGARRQRDEAERNGLMRLSLQGLARECLVAGGVRQAHRMRGDELYAHVARPVPMGATGGFSHSSGDFPLILEAAAHKMMVAAYEGQPVTYPAWCQEGAVSDFNTHKKLRLSEAPMLRKRLEGAPAWHGYLAEERETFSADEFALAIGLTRKMMVNDDLNAFSTLAQLMGEAIADTVENEVWDITLSNSAAGPTMGDGVALFHTTHGNLAGSGAAPSQSTIEASFGRFSTRAGFGQDGAQRPLAVMPAFFLGAWTDHVAASKVLLAQHSATDDTHPPQLAAIRSLVNLHVPQLSLRAERDWYLTGPKNKGPIQVSYLNNVRQPRLRRVEGTTVSGIQWLIEFDLGVDAVEWRTADRNPGA